MAPNVQIREIETSGVLNPEDVETLDGGLLKPEEGHARGREIKLVWRNILLFVYLHVAALYGLWLLLVSAKWSTGLFGEFEMWNVRKVQ